MADIDDSVGLAVRLAYVLGPIAGAIVLGLLLPTIVVVISSISNKWPDHLKLTVIFAAIVLGNTLAVANSGRIIISDADLLAHPGLLATLNPHPGNDWYSRVAHLIILSVSMSEIFLWIIRKRHMGKSQFTLWAAAMGYYVTSVLVSGIVGHFGELDSHWFYAPFVFTATTLLASSDYKKTLRALRWILLVPLSGSLIAIWAAPHLVMETGYHSLIPGFNIRLAGLTEHANSLGLIASIALFLELSKFVSSKPNAFLVLISLSNLVLAQSKTAWIIAMVGSVILASNSVRRPRPQEGEHAGAHSIVGTAFFVASIALILAYLKMDSLRDFLNADRTGLTTAVGRTTIWEITWREFLSNPFSGYGPAIWGPMYRLQHGIEYVGQAHSQYMQVLGQAGLLGALSFSFYLIQLILKSYQGRTETYGFSSLIVAALLIRGFSESPMRMMGILDCDNFVHLLAFLTVAALTLKSGKGQQLP